jgi:hypothetical protein
LLAGLHADFNGDGFDDLAVGAPGDRAWDVGAVNVVYGSRDGLDTPGNQYWNQDSAGITDEPETDDHFGSSLAAGDFNGDGYFDLAIGVSDEDLGSIRNAGAVHILYGSSEGLTATGSQFWHQDSPFIADRAEADDLFGWSLTSGDFNNDGRDDLAVGVPQEDVVAIFSVTDAGAVHILYGSTGGLTATGSQFWHQDVKSVLDDAERHDRFGAALAAGDFDGDGADDLAIGVPNEDLGGIVDAGAASILFGSVATGLTAARDQFWHQSLYPPTGMPGLGEEAESGDQFGGALAAGDFNGDGRDDLAVGVSKEDIELRIFGAPGSDFESVVETLATDAGAVNILYGSAAGGLTLTGSQFWSQASLGILDNPENGDGFGFSVAAGDFNADGRADLAVGVPFERIALASEAGGVNIIYGSTSGLNASLGAPNQFWDEDHLPFWEVHWSWDPEDGPITSAETGDHFGWSLVAGDFNGDGADDLAVSAPDEDNDTTEDVGVIYVLNGRPPLVIKPPFGAPIVSPSHGLTSEGADVSGFWMNALDWRGSRFRRGARFGSSLA